MKKWIATAFAAGALAIGSAASAQDLGGILANIFGFNLPGLTQSQGIPATVATVYTDGYGRRFYYDQYGRQVYIQDTQSQQIVGYDNYGRPIYGSSGTYAYGTAAPRSWDRDGDGVANSRDRWPDDPRYW